ncbi:MAG: monovalent cation/H+ antiporter complex subunit F [Acidimicrobiia bacterium]
MITVTFVALAAAGALFLVSLMRDRSLAGRVIALDGIVTVLAAAIAVEAARTRSGIFLDAIVIVALVGFVATSAAARYVERRGAHHD